MTFFVGLSAELQLAFKCAGVAALVTSAVLLLKASWVVTQPYKTTEVWLMLRKEDRPNAEIAQRIISGVLRDIYLNFALHGAAIAAGMLVLTVVIQLAGGQTKIM